MDSKIGAQLCHAKCCTKIRHATSIPSILLPSHAYLVFLGSHILRPFPLFNYTVFYKTTIIKPINTSVTINNAANIRSESNSTPQNVLEAEIIHQLLIPPNTTQYPSFHSFKPPASLTYKTPPLPTSPTPMRNPQDPHTWTRLIKA